MSESLKTVCNVRADRDAGDGLDLRYPIRALYHIKLEHEVKLGLSNERELIFVRACSELCCDVHFLHVQSDYNPRFSDLRRAHEVAIYLQPK